MSNEDKANELLRAFQGMQFGVEKSKRYHTARAFHHQVLAVAFQIVELCASSAVLFNWLSSAPRLQHAVLAVAAIIAGLALVHQSLKKQSMHMEKKGAFAEIAKLFPADLSKGDESLFERIRNAREDIEKNDGKICECLDVLCHNDECLSRGWPDQCLPLSWLQRNVLVYLPVRYTEPKKATSSDSAAATPAGGRLSSIAAWASAGALGAVEALSCPPF